MNSIKYAIWALIIALTGCAANPINHNKDPVQQVKKLTRTAHIDHGGNLALYVDRVKLSQSTNEKVIIDYTCESVCVVKLSSGPGLRITKTAQFGVHEARDSSGIIDYRKAKRFEEGLRVYKKWIPKCAVKLFETKHAFDRPEITMFTGEEVLKSCPEIKEYAAK